MSQLYDRYLGVQWEERPTDHSIWKRVDNIPNAGTVAHPRTAPRTAGGLRPGTAAGPARTPWRAPCRDRPRRRGARSRGPDHRLRPPLRHLQTRHADLPQPGTAGGHPQQQGPAGADHLRRQGPSARPRRQGADRRDHRTSAAGPSSAAASSSSKITTSTSPATWCRASTSGSTIRAGRWKHRAPAA